MSTTTRAVVPGADAVLVAIDGSCTDLPVLTWAAEEADRTQRPLLISYAAGHLPPQLTYAERSAAREQRLDEGRRVTEQAATWVRAHASAVRVDTVVRLLQPSMLLPAVGDRARTLAQSAAPWSSADRPGARGPVLAALTTAGDANVLRDATDYAVRRGLDVVVLDGADSDLPRRLVERSKDVSMVFLPRPHRTLPVKTLPAKALTWPVVLDAVARSLSPVVLVSGDAEPGAARPAAR